MAKNNVWMSVSDLMTGLMVFFMFVAVAYMFQVQDDRSTLKDYVDNRKKLRDSLVAEFRAEAKQGRISIDGDLSMRFEKAETMFDSGSENLSETFKNELADYIPRYLDILLNASLKDNIHEIRIEGHTDTAHINRLDPDPYIGNLILSQRRALNVMKYIRSLPYYMNRTVEERQLLERWFTAAGMSYSRALDDSSNLVSKTHQRINPGKSRRVEIRLIAAGDSLLKEFIDNLN